MSTLEKTKIVFILADDLAVWAAGCYGNAEIRTPNLDRMAATGVRFENFFVTIPVCSASRASLLGLGVKIFWMTRFVIRMC